VEGIAGVVCKLRVATWGSLPAITNPPTATEASKWGEKERAAGAGGASLRCADSGGWRPACEEGVEAWWRKVGLGVGLVTWVVLGR